MGLFSPSYKQLTDEELMKLSSEGNARAFSELYDRYAKKLLNYFFFRLWKDRERSEDLVHDLFTKIINNPDLFDPKRKFKTWVYSVANNMCKNEYRKEAVRSGMQSTEELETDIRSGSTDVLEDIHENEFKEALNEALDKIDDKHSEVFVLRHFQEMSIKEIAAILECNEGTVKSRLFNVTKRLAGELQVFNPLLNRI